MPYVVTGCKELNIRTFSLSISPLWISQCSIKEKYYNGLNILEDISPLGERHLQKFRS